MPPIQMLWAAAKMFEAQRVLLFLALILAQ
jgi:hypothetical protein